MNKRRKKKELIKTLKRIVDKQIDFVCFKTYTHKGTVLCVLPISHPCVNLQMGDQESNIINIEARVSQKETTKLFYDRKDFDMYGKVL